MIQVKIQFVGTYTHTKPLCKVSSKKNSFDVNVEKNQTFEEMFDFDNEDYLHIEFVNKDGIDDNVVEIKSIEIDNIDLQHYIYQGIFYPQYDPNWLQMQKDIPPKFYKPCTQLRLNGVWKFSIITPIWKMIMNKWLNDNR